jgi:general secretion pathway protein B
MSYILDALRRSQAERDRGQVPGLHAQPNLVPAAPAPQAGRSLVGLGLGLLLGLALVLAWAWQTSAATRKAVAVAPVPLAARGASVLPPAAAAAPAPLPLAVKAPPPVIPVPLAAPGVPPQGLAATGRGLEASPPEALAAAAAASPPAAAARLAGDRLSAEQRRQLPTLSIGGSVWSDSPASRFVIINGQLVHEGQPAAPGVVLERILPRSVVLRWQERLVELPL